MSNASLLLSDGESVAPVASGLNLVKCSRLDRGPSWLVSLAPVPRPVDCAGEKVLSWRAAPTDGGDWRTESGGGGGRRRQRGVVEGVPAGCLDMLAAGNRETLADMRGSDP